MGQNCIAGTTEYDEENGIGLVMYVESGNNMIVWKMSDGTKQGTTVPVSSDYQNMLRTAFENKTGTKIGYFIFHPYTEDTIDVESSITINSGDTPSTKTQWKLKNGIYFMAGTIENNIALYYGPRDGTATLFRRDGTSDGTSVLEDTMKEDIKQAIQKTWKRQVDNVAWIQVPVSWNQKLPDWETYEEVTK